MSIAILDYQKKKSPLKRCTVGKEITEIEELSVTVTKLTLLCGDKIKKKMFNKLKNELNEFDYVISLSDRLKHFENKNEKTTLMTATPVISFKKCIELIKVNPKEEKFAVVVTQLTDKTREICIKLCKNMRFVCLYEKEDSDLAERILNDTGVCVTKGKYPEVSENVAIFIGDNLEINDNINKKT